MPWTACGFWPFVAIGFKTDLRKRERSWSLLIWKVSFKPIQAHPVLGASRIPAQSEKRPRRRDHKRLAGNPVDQRVPTIPPPPGHMRS